jgi:ubiquinone/menaquinone biosynthesis C-methylase UbiE
MKYDATDIPAVYDAGRSLAPAVLTMWGRAIGARAARAQVSTVLDLGCGTGRFVEVLADVYDADVIGVDPSRRMLAQAQAKRLGRTHYATGCAEAIPLRSASVDLVFMSMVFHHFLDPVRVAAECQRLLRPGGWALVRTSTRERIASYPFVPFFSPSRSLLEQRLPSVNDVRRPFEAAGLQLTAADVLVQEIAPTFSEYAARLSLGADSVLTSLTRIAFESGLAALRSFATTNDGPVLEPVDLFCFRA